MTVINLKIAAIHPNILLPRSLHLVLHQLQQRKISFHYPLTVPNIHEEAARLINEALDVYQTDYDSAMDCLKKARRIYLTMHATDEQIFRLEPEPPHLPGQDEAIYHYAEIEHFICNSEGCSAASRGDWHTAYDCF